jgi:hypothetical protein
MTKNCHPFGGHLVHGMGFRSSFDGAMWAVGFFSYLVETFKCMICHFQNGAAKYAIVLGIYKLDVFS